MLRAVVPSAPPGGKGQTATLLQTGEWLLAGGEQGSAPSAATLLLDVTTGRRTAIASLHHARSGHTATVLPDGAVLILGGTTSDGSVVTAAELFDPATRQFQNLAGLEPLARAGHTATLLSDGRLLIVGGRAGGRPLSSVVLWNAITRVIDESDAGLENARAGHLAVLLPNGSVLISGGRDGAGDIVKRAQVFDPQRSRFVRFDERQRNLLPAAPLEARTPEAQEVVVAGVPERLQYLPSVRFSKPLEPRTLTNKTISLVGPKGTIPIRPVVAERGMLMFLHPDTKLLPGTDYDVLIKGAADEAGHELAFVALHFRTPFVSASAAVSPRADLPRPSARLPSAAATGVSPWINREAPQWMSELKWSPTRDSSEDDELWIPQESDFSGKWWSKLPAVQDKPAPQAPPGVTALSGRVLRMNGAPLAAVTLRLGGHATKTDEDGFFLLRDLTPGFAPLEIDGTTANHGNARYGFYRARVEVKPRVTTKLSYIVWMPKLDPQGTVRIPSPTTEETVVSNPAIPGLELHIPANMLIRDRAGQVVTEINITAIPVNQPPFPLPDSNVPVYFTIQPGGAILQALSPEVTGARLFYPNYQREVPGAKGVFWNYDPYERGWFVYGLGTISRDGRQSIPDPGVVITEFSGAMFNSGNAAPGDGGGCGGGDCCSAGGGGDGVGGDGGGGGGNGSDGDESSHMDVGSASSSSCGDPVNIFTGQFTRRETDFFLPDVAPIQIQRTYRSLDLNRRMFGVGMTLDYDVFFSALVNQYQQVDLILPTGQRIHYTRTSPGTSYGNAIFGTSEPGNWSGSTVAFNLSRQGWDLLFKDGSKWFFPAEAPIAEIADRFGNKVVFTRSSSTGPITRVDSPNGRWVAFTINGSGVVTSAQDNAGHTVSYGYDANWRLTSVTNANNETKTYEYTTDNRMFRARSAKGDMLVENTYATGTGAITQQKLGDQTTFLFSIGVPVGAPSTDLITQVTDRRGYVRKVVYDSSNRIKSSTYPLGTVDERVTTFAYDPTSGWRTSITDPLGRTTNYVYDSMGNVTSVTQLAGTPNAVTTSYTYSSDFNQVTSVTDPLQHQTIFAYDASGNLTRVSDPLNHARTMGYDALGRPTTVSDALNNPTTFSYDGGDLVKVTDPLSRSSTMYYDDAGWLRSSTDALGNRTVYSYDPVGRITSVTDPMGNSVSYGYDLNGNMTSSTDQRNNPTTYAYDALNRRISRTDPLHATETFSYAPNGLLDTFTARNGQMTKRTYDTANRLSLIGFGATAQAPTTYESTISYAYDKGDRMLSTADSVGGTISYTYDGLGRMTQETTPLGTVQYSYDNAGRRTEMRPTQQQPVDYSYDNANRLTDIRNAINAQSTQDDVHFIYDNADRRTRLTLRNGVNVDYAYDAASQLTSITYSTATTTIGGLLYDYDAVGRVVREGGSLVNVNLPAAMNGRTYNANNQLTLAGYTYDSNGRLTSNGPTTFTWDARDQLAQMSGGVVGQFSYDALGRRTRKSTNSAVKQFLYDGPNIIQELADGSSPTVTASILTGLDIDEAFGRTKGTAKAEYLSDRLGSTIALSDANANSSTTYSYEPYGKATQSGSVDDNSRVFTGREDDGSGLVYYRARYYDPASARFISQDPAGLGGGDANLYRYTESDPINKSDPTGLLTTIVTCDDPVATLIVRCDKDHEIIAACVCRELSTYVIKYCVTRESDKQCTCAMQWLKNGCEPPRPRPRPNPPPYRPPPPPNRPRVPAFCPGNSEW
jgi:RHS repeat-associated protein